MDEKPPMLAETASSGISTALDSVDGLRARVRALFGPGSFEPNSRADLDLAVSVELGHEPWDVATDQLASSLDHLETWQEVFRAGRMPAFAHLTLIRASMESTVTARWLLDPTASSRDRVARAVGFLVEDYEERRKAEHSLGVTTFTAPAKPAAIRKADLEGQRLADHLPPVQALGYVDLFKRYCVPSGEAGAAIYRALSANAHARRWRLLMNPMLDIGPGQGGSRLHSVSASDDIAVGSTETAVHIIQIAIEEAESYVR